MSEGSYEIDENGVIWADWNCSNMSIEAAIECLDSSNHFFDTNTDVPGECECKCTGEQCEVSSKIRNQSSCECECDPLLLESCSPWEVLVDHGDICKCECDPVKKSECVNIIEDVDSIDHTEHLWWQESNCMCGYKSCENVSPSAVQSCLADDKKYWDEDECECKCYSNISCPNNQVVNASSCECECGTTEDYDCNEGQIVLNKEGFCECGCSESKITDCVVNSHDINDQSDDTWFDVSNCKCECMPKDCPHWSELKFVGNGTCSCECKSKQELNCKDYEVVLDDDGVCRCGCDTTKREECLSSGNLWYPDNCKCKESTFTSASISKGDTSASVNETSIFEGATSATFEPGTENSETMEFFEPWSETSSQNSIENAESKTLSQGVIGPFTTGFAKSHPEGATVVPEFPQTESTTHTISDPHIKTFFGKKYEM